MIFSNPAVRARAGGKFYFIFSTGRTEYWHQIMISFQALLVGKVQTALIDMKIISRRHSECRRCLFRTLSDKTLNGFPFTQPLKWTQSLSAALSLSNGDVSRSCITAAGMVVLPMLGWLSWYVSIGWLVEQGLTSHSTQFRSFRRQCFYTSDDPTNSVKALKEGG